MQSHCFVMRSYIQLLLCFVLLVFPSSASAQGLSFDWQQFFFSSNNKSDSEIASSTPTTMKEAIILKGPEVKIVDSAIPKAGKDQIVLKVVVSGSNPKDWKVPYMGIEVNQGDDPAGYVHEVGEGVTEFKKGDRVTGFHEMLKPGGSYAEYAILWSHTSFHIPDSISFEEAATIPLAAVTAAVGLYRELKLPAPWLPLPDSTKIPLVIWGGSSAVGAFTLQLAKKSNIHPLIVIAGRAQDFVTPFLEPAKGDVVIDYRKGNDAVVEGIKSALKGQKLFHAYDAVSDHGSYGTIFRVLENEGGTITTVLPGKKYEGVPSGVQNLITSCGKVFGEPQDKDFGFVFSKYFGKGLKEGWFKPHPYEIIPGGLGGVQQGLQNLKDGKASAVKYVFRIEDTEGVQKSSL